MVKSSQILLELDQNENMMADQKYSSILEMITLQDIGFSKIEAFTNLRVQVENVNSEIKNYHCVSTTWRHSDEKHGICFRFICNVLNLQKQ